MIGAIRSTVWAMATMAIVAFGVRPAVQAATYYWDRNGSSSGFGSASGLWGTNSYWSASTTGTSSAGIVNPTTSDSLNFGSTTTGLGTGTINVVTGYAGNLTFASGSGAITLSGGTINLADASTITVNNSTDTIGSTLAGATTSLTKSGTGTLILSGTNTYTGLTKVTGGTLQLSSMGALSTSTLDYNSYGGSLSFGSLTDVVLGGLQGNQDLVLNNASGQSVAVNLYNNANTIYSGNLTGSGYVEMWGPGSLTLNGTNTTATVFVDRGTLVLGNSTVLANGTAILLGGALSFGNLTTANIGCLQLASGNLTLNNTLGQKVTLTGSIDDIGAGAVISGSGGLVITGASCLSGSNTFTGDTVLTSGQLVLGGSNALANSTLDCEGGPVFFDQVNTFTLGGLKGNQDLALEGQIGAIALSVGNNNANTTYSGALIGSGSLTKIGTGTLVLTGANTHSGGTTISSGTLQIGSGGTTGSITGNVANNATLAFNRSNALTFAGNISGTGTLTKSGAGTLTLTGVNTYSGGTTISAGTLQVGNGGTTGSIAGNVTDNATLVFNRSNSITFAGNITGTGDLTKAGAGTLTLTGSNSYAGLTTVTGGTLQVTGSLANNGSNKVLVAKDANGVFGDGNGDASISRRVASGSSYAGLGSAITNLSAGELATTADILAGTASAQTDVSMAWRTRTEAEKTKQGGGLISEVLSLSGIAQSGTGVRDGVHQTDMYVLQMSYDPAELMRIWGLTEDEAVAQGRLYLGYFGAAGLVGIGDDSWTGAVNANFGGTSNFVGDHAYNSGYFVLGDYGVDTANNVVWAVINYSGQFAVVPEPSTLVLLGIGAVGLLTYGWRPRTAAA
jgi:fibronectin-binding autotransporter adhesin